MAQVRKYAALPDIDTAPDIFESSTAQDNTSPITSPTTEAETRSSKSSDHSDDAYRRIDHQHITPSQARDQFRYSKVDAAGTDFSDRVGSHHRSYRVTRSARLKNYVLRASDDHLSDDEAESLDTRILRLRRELEEVHSELEKRAVTLGGSIDSVTPEFAQALNSNSFQSVSQTMKLLESQWLTLKAGNAFNDSSNPLVSIENPEESLLIMNSLESQGATEKSSPIEEQLNNDSIRAVKMLSNLDRRMADLEKLVGAQPLSDVYGGDANANSWSVMMSLSAIERKISKLTNAATPTLEDLSHQVQKLSSRLASISESRQLISQVENPQSSESFGLSNYEDDVLENVQRQAQPNRLEQAAQISALYRSLSHMEPFPLILPELIERLRALRILHAEASEAMLTLSRVDREQCYTAEQIKKWKACLTELEGTANKNEKVMGGNLKEVEKWVQQLEQRIQKPF